LNGDRPQIVTLSLKFREIIADASTGVTNPAFKASAEANRLASLFCLTTSVAEAVDVPVFHGDAFGLEPPELTPVLLLALLDWASWS
jgi:hypothetical protein